MRRAPGLALVLVLVMSLFGGAAATLAADPELSGQRPVPEASRSSIAGPGTSTDVPRPSTLDASLLSARGIRQVVVRLDEESVSEVAAAGAGARGQRQARAAVRAQQSRSSARPTPRSSRRPRSP